MSKSKHKKRKKYIKRRRILALIFLVLVIFAISKTTIFIIEQIEKANKKDAKMVISQNIVNTNTNIMRNTNVVDNSTNIQSENTVKESSETTENNEKEEDWQIRLANSEHILPEKFKIELADIDETRQFDKRAIGQLNKMMNDMRVDGIKNVWVQSAYRSVAKQKELYNNSIEKYKKQR